MEKAFLIHSIYRATEGEGIHLGTPQVFVRFQGCAVGCLNCDSKETWEFAVEKPMFLHDVLSEIEKESTFGGKRIKRVSITGGDPLHPKHEAQVIELAKTLKQKGYYLNIEAAGTRVVDQLFDIVDFISFDYKTPSTGVRTNTKLFKKLIEQYPNKHQIKAVVADRKDFEAYYDLYFQHQDTIGFEDSQWVITPCYEPNEEFPVERFLNAMKWNEDFGGPFRIIGQQHKWLHGPSKRNV